MGQWLSERLGGSFIIENRAGAGSSIGTEAVVNSPPDGYSLLMVTTANAVNATYYDRLNYNFLRDIVPVASIARIPNVMEVNLLVPVRTVPEFIAYAKANPGKINFASGGNGSGAHVAGEYFKMMAGVNLTHVPLSRRRACAHRSNRRASTGLLRWPPFLDRVHQGWQAARARDNDRDALGGNAGYPDRR